MNTKTINDHALMRAADLEPKASESCVQAQQSLEALGFAVPGNAEDFTAGRMTHGLRTLLRVLLEPRTFTMAAIHYQLSSVMKDSTAVELATRFSDNRFVCTGNINVTPASCSPPEIDVLQLPTGTEIAAVEEAHREQVATYLRRHPDVSPTPLLTLGDVLAAQRDMNVLKHRHRPSIEVTKAQFETLTDAQARPKKKGRAAGARQSAVRA